MQSEREKQGLLPPRPDDECLRGERVSGGRRPADVWLASWAGGPPGAVDFAVTSGLRRDKLAMAADDPSAIWGGYEEHKRRHLDTESLCRDQGLSLLPFVVEAHGGGLGPVARRVCAAIARAGAARAGEEVEVQAASMVRRISISAHRENARSMLRRLGSTPSGPASLTPAAWDEDPSSWW